MRSTAISVSATSFATLLFLTACVKSNEEIQVEQAALDDDVSLLKSCDRSDVSKVRIETLSSDETAEICNAEAEMLGRYPSVRLLRELSKAVYGLKSTHKETDLVGNATEYMRVARARGQLQDDEAMIRTFNMTFRIRTGMKGRVMPSDLVQYLDQLGEIKAKSISDEALLYDAAAISVMKQDQRG